MDDKKIAIRWTDMRPNGQAKYPIIPKSEVSKLQFKKEQLPCLTNWQHWGLNEYVTALEPGTNFPVGQTLAQKEGNLIFINPGETREYDLEIKIISNAEINDVSNVKQKL